MTNDSRRVHERHPCDFPVVILLEGREVQGVCRNVSLGGLYIVVPETLPYGTQVGVRFRLPALREDTELLVTVRWTTHEGVGVQFGSLRALEVWGLNRLCK